MHSKISGDLWTYAKLTLISCDFHVIYFKLYVCDVIRQKRLYTFMLSKNMLRRHTMFFWNTI